MNILKIKTLLEKVCGTGKIITPLQYIYFRKGYVYASNGKVHIKQNLSLHEVCEEAKKTLDGYCIHKDMLKYVRAAKSDMRIEPHVLPSKNKIIAVNYMVGTTPVSFFLRQTEDIPRGDKVIDDIDHHISNFKMKAAEKITIIPESVELIRKSFVRKTSGLTIYMDGSKERMLVTPNEDDYNEIALMVPLMISGKLKTI